jgi:2-polyprenyl-3-methyl-5-hydroxy-6-metoxy-1,4-benzoquinol methylase
MIKFLFADLKKRSNEVELMDLPDCDEKELINTIEQFKFINRFFTRSRYLIKKYIINEIKKDPKKNYTFLDVGAGGCDIAYWLLKKCKKRRYNVKVVCLDYDIRIFKYVKKKFNSVNDLKIINISVFELEKVGKFDFIFANHFLHHFQSKDIPSIINLIANQTKKLFLLNDIYRSRLYLFQHSLLCKYLFHNSFVYYDGNISIKKGFKTSEMYDFIKKADNKNFIFKIKRKFLFRIYLVGIKKN